MIVVVSLDTYYTIPSTIPNDQLYWDSTTDITIKADVYITSLAANGDQTYAIVSPGPTGTRNEYGLGIVGTNKCSGMCSTSTPGAVLFLLATEGVCFLWITTTTTVSLNTWTTIMVKRISGSYSLYINGVSQATISYGSVDSNVIGNAALPIIVGSNLNGQLRNLFVNSKLIGKHHHRYYLYHYYYYYY